MITARLSLVAPLLAVAACASTPPPPPATAAPSAEPARAEPAPPPPTSHPAAAPVRSASAILGDAIKAIGTPDAWTAHKTAHLTMTMSFQALGITGSVERFATATDKSLVITQIPGVGIIREGSNGKVVWSQDPINGLRILDGAEAEQARAESTWNPELRVNDLYQKVDSLTQTGSDGKPLECVVLTPKLAPPTTRCYDSVTHLQVSESGTHPTPQGDTPFTSTVADWRVVGGLRTPFLLETQAGPVTFNAKLQTVVYDEPLDDQQFEPPQPSAPTPAPASGETGASGANPAKGAPAKGADKGTPAKSSTGKKSKGAAKPKAPPAKK